LTVDIEKEFARIMVSKYIMLTALLLVCIPYQTSAVECTANITAESQGKVTTFRFTVGEGCPAIYGFYVTPTDNDKIDVKASPKGWSGGGVKHNFIIWTTKTNPVHSNEISGEFVATFSRADSHELNWSVADVGLGAVAWGKIIVEKPSESTQAYSREDGATADKGYLFSFTADKVCIKKSDSTYCAKVWGSGHFTPDRDSITGRGDYEIIVDGKRDAKGTWTAVDLISGYSEEVTFIARYVKGDIGAILKEGSAGSPAKLCLYGKIINIPDPKDATCSKTAIVKIG
jgi:hypothetical protein